MMLVCGDARSLPLGDATVQCVVSSPPYWGLRNYGVGPCVLAGCPPGGVVLDPFCGSGTVGVVAARHGRQFVGVELKPEYLTLAQARLEGLSVAPISDKQAAVGSRTYTGFNARWASR